MASNIKMVAAVHDLSGFGRCSLTAAIPVLSVMGLHCCPMPTAVLSNQTGYKDFSYVDFSAYLPEFIAHWEKLGLRFDTLYSGFLGGEAQIDIVADFIARFKRPETLVAVDPVMGDNGALYPSFTEGMCSHMKKLVRYADIVFPNTTEAMLLTDGGFSVDRAEKRDIDEAARKISLCGPKRVVVTGAVCGGKVTNYVYDFAHGEYFEVSAGYNNRSYSGTGDIFASIVCGSLTLGRSLRSSVMSAAAFIEKAARFTEEHGGDTREGIIFEPFLKELA